MTRTVKEGGLNKVDEKPRQAPVISFKTSGSTNGKVVHSGWVRLEVVRIEQEWRR